MRYEKPVVMELGRQARHAEGQSPLLCVSGDAATGGTQTCGTGNGASYTCSSGTSGAGGSACYGGSTPGSGFEDCIAGVSAFYCASGASGATDPAGCNVGPSVAP